jgi:MFS family permease
MTTASNREVHRWRAFTVLAVSYFMTIVDLTIVNVALPTIGRKLHFTESNLQWVVTAYGLTFGGFLLLGGRAADLLGRRRIMMVGLALFTTASFGAGLATSAGFLIAMRALQGLGAAVVLPAALSIVTNLFTEGADRNRALGAWGAIGGTAATIGLISGGLVTRYVGWQYIFFLNVPAGATALLLARRIVPESRLEGIRRRFDPLGAITVTGGVARTRLCDLERAAGRLVIGPHRRPACRLGGPAGRVPCGRVARRGAADAAPHLPNEDDRCGERGRAAARRQLLRLRLRRHPLHAAGARLLGAADRRRLAHHLAHLGRVGGLLAKARHPYLACPRNGSRDDGDRRRILWATQVSAHGHFWASLVGPFFVVGAGGAFSFVPISIGGLTGVAEREAGLASGLLNTSQQLGGAIGVAIASTVAATHLKTLLANGEQTGVALTGGFQWAFWVCGAIALLAPATTALILRGKRRSQVEDALPALEVGGLN